MISLSMTMYVNAAFCALAAALLYRAINRMNASTDHAMRFAFVLMCAGLVGEAFATKLPAVWQEGIDTLLFGGLFAWIVGTRRAGTIAGIPEAWRGRVSVVVSAIAFLVFLAGVT
jgi:hypothetical protein